jgi:DNA adenine methylase
MRLTAMGLTIHLSPLRYPGGKTRLADFLARAIDRNFDRKEKVTLVEPYAGGAGASLALLTDRRVAKIVINDLDRAIFAFWKIATTDSEYLIRKIRRTPVSIEQWHVQHEIYSSPDSTDRQLAFATLFLNRTNRSGIIEGRPIGGFAQEGDWTISARFTKATIIKRLRNIERLRHKIVVSNRDGIALLETLEKRKRKNRYFIFLDPPYYEQGSSLYFSHYDASNHEALAKHLKTSSLKWIMTYDETPFIRNLYGEMKMRKFHINHSAQLHKVGQEVLIFGKGVSRVNP